ncbi:MAG TPA: DUF6492 family protein [Verrucomicrobiae bacterium]|nr:DUF6492 family protein [Verrucomicrobiae bacterium]
MLANPIKPVDVVAACLKRDLPLLSLAHKNLQRFVAMKQLHVITARNDFPHFANALGREVVLLDENEMIPGVTLAALKVIPLAKFSQGPGWYFQQLLKFQFAFQKTADDHYLIWDADTVPLRRLELFDAGGRMLLTKAQEYHRPYFQTYEKILGRPAQREFSFIAQHMVIRKSILREMLGEIERHCAGDENWAWKIMRNLAGEGSNRFSEYETYGHYLKEKHPETAVFRDLPWLRHGASECGRHPSAAALEKLGEKYFYASFEESERFYRRTGRKVRDWMRRMEKKLRT